MYERRSLIAVLLLAGCSGAGPSSHGGAALDGGVAPQSQPGSEAGGPFQHPGVLVNLAQLDFVKAKVKAGSDPWSSGFAAALASPYAATTYAPKPLADVDCGPDSNPDIGCSAEMGDAIAAYTQALLWAVTGASLYAQKAIEIMNAWSATLTEHTGSNAPLQSAWAGSVFPRAAEIIRYTGAGWAPADIARFEAMLKNVYLPEVVNGAPRENGNWELSMVEAAIGIAVFLDDQATFEKAVSMWRARVPAYIYMQTDGTLPVPPPGGDYVSAGSLQSFWYGPTSFVDGLCQETCRDLGHAQYGLAAMVHAAETARIQGIDLYAEQSRRIVAAFELQARYLGATPPPTPCSVPLVAVTPDPTWEVGYNEYANRLGMALPDTNALLRVIRPTGSDHHMDWETFTHAEVGSVGLR
jgi:hypothetical protein